MRMPIVGLLLVATGMTGCAAALPTREAECDLRPTLHGVCGMRAPTVESPGPVASTAQVRLLTHREELRQR
jgi:hypothetical protein